MNKKVKKVLIVQPSSLLGGAERQAALLAVLLSDEYAVDFLSFHHNNDSLETQKLLVGTNVRSELIESFYPSNYFYKLVRFIQLAFYLVRNKYDYVLAYQYEMNFAVGVLRSLGMVKTAVWNQRDEGFNAKLKPTLAFALKKYDLFIANSEGGASFLKTKLNVHVDKIRVIPNAVDITKFSSRSEWRKKYGFSYDEILLCMVANIHQNKDHITLVRAMEILIKRNISCKLLLFGYKGNTFEHVRHEVCQRNLSSSVLFMGPTKDVSSVFNACDMSILSSPSEGLSNTMLESMCVGIPFVGTNVRGISTVVGDDYPFLFSLGDAQDAANIIERVLNNSELTKMQVDRCRNIVRECYSLDNLKKHTMESLRNIKK